MERKMLTRYLILITVLMLFAGAAWYFMRNPGAPRGDVVLAGLKTGLEAEFPLGEEVSYEL